MRAHLRASALAAPSLRRTRHPRQAACTCTMPRRVVPTCCRTTAALHAACTTEKASNCFLSKVYICRKRPGERFRICIKCSECLHSRGKKLSTFKVFMHRMDVSCVIAHPALNRVWANIKLLLLPFQTYAPASCPCPSPHPYTIILAELAVELTHTDTGNETGPLPHLHHQRSPVGCSLSQPCTHAWQRCSDGDQGLALTLISLDCLQGAGGCMTMQNLKIHRL